MEIHDLNTKTLTDPAYVAFDDGTDTYKAEFNDAVEEKAAAAVAAADLTQNQVAFTSGDAASPTAWANVSVITSGSTLATLFSRISTMVKNVRYIWSLIGTTAMGTTATTITGAIHEHETDISTLNGNLNTRVADNVSINRARIASSSGNAIKLYAKASAAGSAFGTALVSNNSRLWFIEFNPNTPHITNLVGTGGTITYDSSTLTFTITSPTTGQMTIWAGGGIGSTGTITFGT